MINKYATALAAGIAALAIFTLSHAAEWTDYGGDKGGMRYSDLDQINRANVADLEQAWVYHTGISERRGEFAQFATFENTPIMVGGKLVMCTPFRRVVALDPTTGKELWAFDSGAEVPEDGNFRIYNCRGVSQWLDEEAHLDAVRVLRQDPRSLPHSR